MMTPTQSILGMKIKNTNLRIYCCLQKPFFCHMLVHVEQIGVKTQGLGKKTQSQIIQNQMTRHKGQGQDQRKIKYKKLSLGEIWFRKWR